MSRPLICGVDDSQGAREAVRVAAYIAEYLEQELMLVHVGRLPAVLDTRRVPYAFEELCELALVEAEALVERVAADAGQDCAEQRAKLGSAVDLLRQTALDEDAALLVVGCRGEGQLRAALLGSVPAALCRTAPCSVVVVPPGALAAFDPASAGGATATER